jgi:hypothetical protein
MIPTHEAGTVVDLCEDADRHVDLQLWERNKGSFTTKPGPLTVTVPPGSQATVYTCMQPARSLSTCLSKCKRESTLGQGKCVQANFKALSLSLVFISGRHAHARTLAISISSMRHACVVF